MSLRLILRKQIMVSEENTDYVRVYDVRRLEHNVLVYIVQIC